MKNVINRLDKNQEEWAEKMLQDMKEVNEKAFLDGFKNSYKQNSPYYKQLEFGTVVFIISKRQMLNLTNTLETDYLIGKSLWIDFSYYSDNRRESGTNDYIGPVKVRSVITMDKSESFEISITLPECANKVKDGHIARALFVDELRLIE